MASSERARASTVHERHEQVFVRVKSGDGRVWGMREPFVNTPIKLEDRR